MRKIKNIIGNRVFKCKYCGSLFSYRGCFKRTEAFSNCYHSRCHFYRYYEKATDIYVKPNKDLTTGPLFEELSKQEVKLLKLLYGYKK